MVVVDFDTIEPKGLPQTAIARTGRGLHVYFQAKEPYKSCKFDGGDIKAQGGYVVAPPSIHPNGGSYGWADYLSPKDTSLEPYSDEMIKRLTGVSGLYTTGEARININTCYTGLRVQELCDIRLKDLDISDRKGKVVVQSGKGGKYREVPLNLDARQSIQQYMAERRSESHYLFITQRSPKMTTWAVQFILQKYSRLTGIEVTPHILRHTFCHELAVRKVPLDVIARLAGHMKKDGTPNLTMVTRYTLPNEDDQARAVEELSWR